MPIKLGAEEPVSSGARGRNWSSWYLSWVQQWAKIQANEVQYVHMRTDIHLYSASLQVSVCKSITETWFYNGRWSGSLEEMYWIEKSSKQEYSHLSPIKTVREKGLNLLPGGR